MRQLIVITLSMAACLTVPFTYFNILIVKPYLQRMSVVHNTLSLAHATLDWRSNCNTYYFLTGVILAYCANKVAKQLTVQLAVCQFLVTVVVRGCGTPRPVCRLIVYTLMMFFPEIREGKHASWPVIIPIVSIN